MRDMVPNPLGMAAVSLCQQGSCWGAQLCICATAALSTNSHADGLAGGQPALGKYLAAFSHVLKSSKSTTLQWRSMVPLINHTGNIKQNQANIPRNTESWTPLAQLKYVEFLSVSLSGKDS